LTVVLADEPQQDQSPLAYNNFHQILIAQP
jgi:hypothetical protein